MKIASTLTPLVLCVCLAACETIPVAPVSGRPGPAEPAANSVTTVATGPITFIDTGGFDRDFARLADSDRTTVELSFYSPVTPNQLPERLQKWLGAVEKHGGTVSVQAPPGEMTPKSPALIASLLGSAWSGIKVFREMLQERMYASVKGRDAVIVLQRNAATGAVSVARLEFPQRPPAAETAQPGR